MILTPTEVALRAKKALFWELAEYVSEALVGIGCLGEYIAEYSKWPRNGPMSKGTDWVEDH